jgi:hypothetical protein
MQTKARKRSLLSVREPGAAGAGLHDLIGIVGRGGEHARNRNKRWQANGWRR